MLLAAALASLAFAAGPSEPPGPPGPQQRVGNLAQYVGADDYPPEALRRGQQGTVRFSVTVGTGGRVVDCTITRSSGYAELDEGTCRLARRKLRFTPGRLAGRTVAMNSVPFGITWTLPGVAPAGQEGPD